MSKDVKFNINLSVNGKDVVVQCKQGVQELQRNLMAAKTGSQRLARPFFVSTR